MTDLNLQKNAIRILKERNTLRAEVERLRGERDELQAALEFATEALTPTEQQGECPVHPDGPCFGDDPACYGLFTPCATSGGSGKVYGSERQQHYRGFPTVKYSPKPCPTCTEKGCE